MSWLETTIGEVCEVIAGQSPEGSFYNDKGDGMPFYQGKKEFGEKYLGEPTTWTSYVTKVAEPGDILMSVRAPVGPVNFTPTQVCIGRGLAAIRARNVDKEFLFYALLAKQDEISGRDGAVFPTINKKEIEAIELSVPPLPEQQRIVTKLDAAFVALREAEGHVERNRANARELFESYLNGVFEGKEGWVTRPLSEFIHVKHGFAFLGEHFTQSGDYVLLTMGNFFESGGYRDRGEKQKYYVGPIPEEFVLSQGDLVVAMTEQAAGLLGAPLLVPESGKFLHNQRIGLVQQPNGVVVLNEFLFHIFNTKPFRDAVHASGSGVKVRHTSPTKIGEVEVSYPTSLNEQRRIVDALASLEKETKQLEATYQQKLRELEMLKKSVLGAAFSGEL